MTIVAATTASAGVSQRAGNRGGSARQLVSATTVCRRPANQRSARLTAVILRRAASRQPVSAAISIGTTSMGSQPGPCRASSIAMTVQQTPIMAVRRKYARRWSLMTVAPVRSGGILTPNWTVGLVTAGATQSSAP